jgi:fatty acid synthase subunit alpha
MARTRLRALQSYKAMSEMMITNSLVKTKEAPPYSSDLERRVLMNSMARAALDEKTGSYSFTTKLGAKDDFDVANAKAISEISQVLARSDVAKGVGIDHGAFSERLTVSKADSENGLG